MISLFIQNSAVESQVVSYVLLSKFGQ